MRKQESNYNKFTAEDLALDEKFQQWVLQPDQESNLFWKQFLTTFPDRKKVIEDAKQLILAAGLSGDAEADQAYLNTWKKIEEEAQQSSRQQQNKARPRYALLAAACIAIVIVVAYLLWNNANPPVYETFRTASAEIRTVTLKDGSLAVLNANTTLTYLSDFTSDRSVLVEGEAFFNVTKTKDRQKFIVRTAESVATEVLGTEFNVKTRRGNIEIFLKEGSINVTSVQSHVTLTPGEKAVYNKSSKALDVSSTTASQADDLLGWMQKVFIYDDEPLYIIAREVEDHYGVSIAIQDKSLGDRKFTGKIPGHSLETTLEVLSKTLELSIEKKADQIVIKPLED
jgi:ferric-dicitrate binding protein FerR (iron transport regulator)